MIKRYERSVQCLFQTRLRFGTALCRWLNKFGKNKLKIEFGTIFCKNLTFLKKLHFFTATITPVIKKIIFQF